MTSVKPTGKIPVVLCEHKWVYLRTVRRAAEYDPYTRMSYKKYDVFFCEKCLEKKEVPCT